MKVIITNLICKATVIISTLAFVAYIVRFTGNTNFLWLLFLVLVCEFIPNYKIGKKDGSEEPPK